MAAALLTISANAANVNLQNSSFTWKGTKVTGEHYGPIKLKSAKLETNKSGEIKSGEFVIDMSTIKITDLSGEWGDKFLAHIKSADFFDIQKFPTSKLVIKSVKNNVAYASLTIKGKTNDVKVKFTQKGNAYEGELKFDRTKFDMIYGSGNFFKNLGDKTIHNEVSLKFKVLTK
jgi:polyisoprenoid-binding protein YceI